MRCITRLITVSGLLGGRWWLWRLLLRGRIGGIWVWIGWMGLGGVRIHGLGKTERRRGLGRRRRTRRDEETGSRVGLNRPEVGARMMDLSKGIRGFINPGKKAEFWIQFFGVHS